MEMDAEKSTFNAFERFLYWFFIPIVFTMVLIGALLSLFDYNVMNGLLKVGQKVPGLSAVLPEPKGETVTVKPTVTPTEEAEDTPEAKVEAAEKMVTNLKKQLEEQKSALQSTDAALQQKTLEVQDLKAKLTFLEEEKQEQARTEEEYQASIRETAAIYAKMAPSKSAPVMESLTLSEQVLLLSQMSNAERVRILEKMNPQKAAEASILLKDVVPAKDLQIAALQERLKLKDTATASKTSAITKEDLSQTFANMTAKSAAALLIEMEKKSSSKVTEILNNMDVAARSKIMSALAEQSKETAASITVRLAP